MQLWVLLDLLDQFFVREAEARLDDHGTQCNAKRYCWRSKSFAELSHLIILKLIPRNELSQLGRAIVG